MSVLRIAGCAALLLLAGVPAVCSQPVNGGVTSPVALSIALPPVPANSVFATPVFNQPASNQGSAPVQMAAVPAGPAQSWMTDKPNYFTPFGFAWNDGKWFVSGYLGVGARANLSTILLRGRADYTSQYLLLGTLGREIGSLGNLVRFEWETGLGLHFGNQEFIDAHLYFVARWIAFPWNRWIPTTIAIGTGPSLASAKPDLENEKGLANYYKNGLMLELTLAPPESPDWMIAARMHHRSSVFGLLHNGSPSDYVTVGIKHRF
jgi:hypothetical protein